VTEQIDFGSQIVWRPTPEYIEKAHLTRFMRQHNIINFEELVRRSTKDVAWFTESLLNYLDIQFYEPYSKVIDLSRGIAWPRWCLDGKMNIVHNCLDKYAGTAVEGRTAVIWEGEDGNTLSLSYGELHSQVNQAANALRSLGLGKGDAIGIYMPMTPEIVVALLAIAKIGGIILPLFSGYGVGAVVTRLVDANAKALFTADGFSRRGKPIAMKPVADKAAAQVPTLQHMIVLNYAGLEVDMIQGRDYWWNALIKDQPRAADTEVTLAEDTLMVIYTSGTTGKPKGAIHTHCSFPVKATQDMAFGTDLHPGQVIYWMTDMGWMMGPWLVFGSLILGGTLFIYDGAPDYPSPDRTWDMVERHKITTLGISPTFIRAMIRYGDEPIREHDLSSLHLIASTGEPWNPDPWLWLFDVVGQRKIPIINYSGGTEISGGIIMGNPLMPIKPCAITAPCPGIAADVFNENGQPVRGEVGELVIKAPWIGMTRGFWRDPKRYEETYWSRWTDVWVHGDFAIIDEDDHWYILGRSDDTIKVAGKRLGPAEVESILVSHPDVVEAAVIGVPDEIKGSAVVAFCVLTEDCNVCDELIQELNQLVVTAMGKPLAPREIRFISDLPKTRNAKVMRRMIRSAYLGESPGDTSSLVNPEAVDEIKIARYQK
jgi:acetyl-CoA synthetase